jgi:PKD repeat protein
MTLYIDGALTGTNTGTTTGQAYTGYWRVGGDNLTGWPSVPRSNYLSGSIDDVAVYPSALTLSQVRQQYLDSGRGGSGFQLPNAAFSYTPTNLSVQFNGTASNDPDGSITNYAWDFGDGTSASGATASAPSHLYGASGTYHVSLTVTDNSNGTDTETQDVTVQAANVKPTAAFTSNVTGADVTFDGSGSHDSDGTVQSYSWDFGDGNTGSGASPTIAHTYTSSGTFHVALTVTDDRGGTDSVTHDVTVATQPPHAAFTSSTALTTASFDGSGSTSLDATITSYDWDFGDGTTHGSGVTTQHVYTAPGTYQVTLNIGDSTGQHDSITHPVTVSNIIAADTFNRTVSNGWGNADTGGAWSRTGGAANFSVDGSRAQVTLATAGVSPTATLDSVSATDVNVVADVSLNKVPVGDSAYAILVARHSGAGDVRLKLRIMPGGVVHLAWSTVSTKEVQGGEKAITGLTYNAGDTLRVRMRLVGTAISGTVWNPSTGSEPGTAQITGTVGAGGTAAVTGAGSVGLYSGLAGAATNAPIALRYDNLSVTLG